MSLIYTAELNGANPFGNLTTRPPPGTAGAPAIGRGLVLASRRDEMRPPRLPRHRSPA